MCLVEGFKTRTYNSYLKHKINTLHWDQMADGHLGLGLNGRWPFGVGSGGQVSHFRPVTSPWLTLPTQSHMADDLKS